MFTQIIGIRAMAMRETSIMRQQGYNEFKNNINDRIIKEILIFIDKLNY